VTILDAADTLFVLNSEITDVWKNTDVVMKETAQKWGVLNVVVILMAL
jgi:hypothetical protein